MAISLCVHLHALIGVIGSSLFRKQLSALNSAIAHRQRCRCVNGSPASRHSHEYSLCVPISNLTKLRFEKLKAFN